MEHTNSFKYFPKKALKAAPDNSFLIESKMPEEKKEKC